MIRTIFALCLAMTLAACGGPELRAPTDVTPAELAVKDQCVKLIKDRLPSGTKIVETSIDRSAHAGTLNLVVGVNYTNTAASGMCLTTGETIDYMMVMADDKTTTYEPAANGAWHVR